MLDKIKQSIAQAGETIKEQAAAIGDAAKEKGYALIDQWISILPKLEGYGMKVKYFAVSVSINPSLEVELRAKSEDFTPERIEALMIENAKNTPMTLVFSTIKTTWQFHRKARIAKMDPMTVRIQVRLSPEIKVAFGMQLLE